MYGNTKKSQIAKAMLRKKSGIGAINLPDFRLYYKATVIKTVWYWHKNRNIDQWNKIESPKVNLRTCRHLIFEKEETICSGEKIVSLVSSAGKTAQLYVKNEIRILFNTKINSKWTKDLNVTLGIDKT